MLNIEDDTRIENYEAGKARSLSRSHGTLERISDQEGSPQKDLGLSGAGVPR